MTRLTQWLPAALLGLGAVGTIGIDVQRAMPLRLPLDSAMPSEVGDYVGEPVELSVEQVVAAGVTAYAMRLYANPGAEDTPWLSVYVGYYDKQLHGKTIHSPKNCMPGGGWDPLSSSRVTVETSLGSVPVNRYILQKGREQVLVLYWYQGRGRVAANEYKVKFDLLRDAAVERRTEEALVRVVVPITSDAESSFRLAEEAARVLVPSLATALPEDGTGS